MNGGETNVVTPWSLSLVRSEAKYFLTGRGDITYPTIRLSDHLDFRGLMKMIHHVSPQEILVYHPEGTRSSLLAHHLRQCGLLASWLGEIEGYFR
jgi:putative mRNA 3-end processing factor